MPRRKVTGIRDGDTFRVSGGKIIRLANVRAPEKGTKGGAKARADLKKMIGGKTVSYDPKAMSYGRIVANVKVGSKSVNQAMRGKGYTNKGR